MTPQNKWQAFSLHDVHPIHLTSAAWLPILLATLFVSPVSGSETTGSNHTSSDIGRDTKDTTPLPFYKKMWFKSVVAVIGIAAALCCLVILCQCCRDHCRTIRAKQPGRTDIADGKGRSLLADAHPPAGDKTAAGNGGEHVALELSTRGNAGRDANASAIGVRPPRGAHAAADVGGRRSASAATGDGAASHGRPPRSATGTRSHRIGSEGSQGDYDGDSVRSDTSRRRPKRSPQTHDDTNTPAATPDIGALHAAAGAGAAGTAPAPAASSAAAKPDRPRRDRVHRPSQRTGGGGSTGEAARAAATVLMDPGVRAHSHTHRGGRGGAARGSRHSGSSSRAAGSHRRHRSRDRAASDSGATRGRSPGSRSGPGMMAGGRTASRDDSPSSTRSGRSTGYI